MFQRTAGAGGATGITGPMGLHHMSPSGSSDHRDMRPILDNLSTSSTSTNNDSFLGGTGVSSNPASRLLLATSGSAGVAGGRVGKKGRKKDSRKLSKSGQQAIFSPQTASYHCEYSSRAVCYLLWCVCVSASLAGDSDLQLDLISRLFSRLSSFCFVSPHHPVPLFGEIVAGSPDTSRHVTDACNSPNCNFKMQHPVSSASAQSIAGVVGGGGGGAGRRFTAASAANQMTGHLHHNPTTRSSSYPPSGHAITVTTGSGVTGSYHLPPTSSRFQSLFRPEGMMAANFSRFHSMHTMGKESEAPATTNSTYHRLNPLFEQTEGSFRSAYP